MGRRPKKRGRDVHGVVLVDKPIGLSSNQVLQKVKRIFNANRAGHTGTLDPMATGLLPICLGEATKIAAFLTDADKSYEAVLQLGEQTTTSDKEGEVVQSLSVPNDWASNVERVFVELVGKHQQVPPMYSAIKVDGKPLYKSAREGIEIERKSREIEVYGLHLLEADMEKNLLRFSVDCSKGTYVRTLGELIADKLGTCGHLSALRRTKVFPYDALQMRQLIELEDISKDFLNLDSTLLRVDTAIEDWDVIQLDPELKERIMNGQRIRLFDIDAPREEDKQVRVYVEEEFIGIGELKEGVLHPSRIMQY